MSKKISLKQFLMRSGSFGKVYDCIAAIKSKKITVDGKIITNPNHFLNPKKSHVMIQGKTIRRTKNLYYIMNKPAGYLSQKSADEKTIYDLIDKESKSLFAVGRLDKETEGLMLLTNDGKLASLIANPKNKLEKKYYAVIEKPLQMQALEKLKKGVKIKIDDEDYLTKPAKIKRAGEKEIYITITEGRKRQIRKMLEAVGNKVVYLKRVSIGGITLKDLKPGEIRQLAREEVYGLLNVQ
ncbi:rRNA pseudouridine synthase [Candidatus Woesearchaeota archaeon]|nr:rRNA pseudouridine synthase [Candidatus Woesearchaeota archaeon]